MESITLSVEIPPNRRLTIELPADIPTGQADVIIRPHSEVDSSTSVNSAREAARAKLLAAGSLVTDIHAPAGAIALSNEELEKLGQLAPGAHSSEVLLDDERGSY